MKTKITQKDVWYLIEHREKQFKENNIRISALNFVHEAIEKINRDNNIEIPYNIEKKLHLRFIKKYGW